MYHNAIYFLGFYFDFVPQSAIIRVVNYLVDF